MALDRLDNLLNLFRKDFYMTEIQKILEEFYKENQRQRESGDIRSALVRLAGYLFVCNKYNCISCAKYVANFLTHKSNIVSSFAATALLYIMEMIRCAVLNETDPVVRNGMRAELSVIISTIRDFCQYGQIHSEIRFDVDNILLLGEEILSSDSPQEKNKNLKRIDNNEALAIFKILQLLMNYNESNCTDCIKINLNYLTYESDLVKDLAADTLINLIKKTALDINLENNPKRRKEISAGLQEIFNKLSNLINRKKISRSRLSKVNKALTIANESLRMEGYRNTSDEYTTVNDSIERLTRDCQNK